MAENEQRIIWLRQAKQGDSVAMAKLLVAYHSTIKARATEKMGRTLRARMEPDDVLQETYLQATRQMRQFEGKDPHTFLNWVLTILDNRILNATLAMHRQRRDISREVSQASGMAGSSCMNLLDQLYRASATPSQVVRRGEAVAVLSSCLAGLSDSHAKVLQLRFLDGNSVEEVALRMNISKPAVVALTGRALKALRKSIDCVGELTRID